MNQLEMIKAHVNRYGSIDAAIAWDVYGIQRLASRVHDLKYSCSALKSITHESIKGAVRYVPDWTVREQYKHVVPSYR